MKVYKNKIEEFLDMAADDAEIADLKECSPSLWSYCMVFIRDNLIKPHRSDLFLDNGVNDGRFKAINYAVLDWLCDIYLNLCMKYDKVVTISDFEYMTGIDNQVIYSLRDRIDIYKDPLNIYINNIKEGIENNIIYLYTFEQIQPYMLTSKPGDIYKKLHSAYQASLTGRLNGGKGNPIGTIAQLNHYYGWNDNQQANTVKVIVQRSSDEIAQSYGIETANTQQIGQKGTSEPLNVSDLPPG